MTWYLEAYDNMDELIGILIDKSGSMKGAQQFETTDGEWVIQYGRNQAVTDRFNALLKANKLVAGNDGIYTGTSTFKAKAKYYTWEVNERKYSRWLGNIQEATISGFNQFLTLQQYRLNDCYVHMAQFDDSFIRMYDCVPIGEVPLLGPREYTAEGGGTHSYDALVQMVGEMESRIRALPEDERPSRVTVMMQTDGDDMGSKHSAATCKSLLARKRAEGWKFIFLAAGKEAAESGLHMGFEPQWTLTYEPGEDSEKAFNAACVSILESLVAPGASKGLKASV